MYLRPRGAPKPEVSLQRSSVNKCLFHPDMFQNAYRHATCTTVPFLLK